MYFKDILKTKTKKPITLVSDALEQIDQLNKFMYCMPHNTFPLPTRGQ